MAKYKRYNNKKFNILGWILSSSLIIIIIIASYFIIKLKLDKRDIDKVTLCDKNFSYGKHIILVDITDKYNFMQINDIKLNLENIIKKLEKGKQVKVYFLNDNVTEKDLPVINICNPGTGSDSSYIYSNPKLIEKQWNEKFYKPLSNTMNVLENDQTYSYSPIIEMIQWINIVEFKNSNENENKLTIISDMIQNSKEYSFFKNKINNFEETSFFNKYRTNMKNFEVQIMLTRRDNLNKFQTPEYIDFWIKYFGLQNAVINSIKRIDG